MNRVISLKFFFLVNYKYLIWSKYFEYTPGIIQYKVKFTLVDDNCVLPKNKCVHFLYKYFIAEIDIFEQQQINIIYIYEV